ncbi:Uncharacterized conserved protein YbbK, DUF523 family [Streptococcus equinus]|uniref:Uncharacterized conserved protein YbbK, DUF523 family n=1 Tax=Streptococcus equinus TaxID=1335 RepID=A0A1H0QX42_STREI|nr:DUF523 domain-containing protein [Streptococcus equinus]SDP21715.1 Uncharacterized conserved protein YbbK, DUF523 family [Streptococcus equinus]
MGERCKYNGGHNYNPDLVDYVADKEVITICPEVLAGLPTPREPVELRDGHVIDVAGNCYDDLFEKGIERCLSEIAEKDIDLAVLQSRSPSCGVNQIYDGNFSGQKVAGSGLFAQKLKSLGYHVLDVEDIKQLEGK